MKTVIRKVTPLLAVFCLIAMSLTAAAANTHYRWVDDRGQPVHSDRPPPAGTDYEVVSTGSSLVRKVSGDEGVVPAETTPRVGNKFDQVDIAASKEIEKNPEYCERATKNLQALENSAKIRVRNDQGEFRILTPEEREAEVIKAKEGIAIHC